MNNDILIDVKNLSKEFEGKKVVSNISFCLNRGSVLGLLGPNGAGKTTTIKMAVGLITPLSGLAKIKGFNTSINKQRVEANKHIGVLLEGARNTYWRLSPIENLRFFGANRGMKRKDIDNKIPELLSLLNLESHADKMVGKLSQVMKQKVALANALIHNPDILILDEPTLGLDIDSAQKIEETVTRLAKKGKGVILTTHVMKMAERITDEIIVIKNGEIAAQGPTNQLISQFDTRKN